VCGRERDVRELDECQRAEKESRALVERVDVRREGGVAEGGRWRVEVCGTGWERLVTPALLVGSLGQIIATFLGLTVGTLVLQHL
jgi:hypothetical protein